MLLQKKNKSKKWLLIYIFWCSIYHNSVIHFLVMFLSNFVSFLIVFKFFEFLKTVL